MSKRVQSAEVGDISWQDSPVLSFSKTVPDSEETGHFYSPGSFDKHLSRLRDLKQTTQDPTETGLCSVCHRKLPRMYTNIRWLDKKARIWEDGVFIPNPEPPRSSSKVSK